MNQSKQHRVLRIQCHSQDYDTVRLRLDTFCSFGDRLAVWSNDNIIAGTIMIEYDDGDASFIPIPPKDDEAIAAGKCLVEALRFYASGGVDGGEMAKEALREFWGI